MSNATSEAVGGDSTVPAQIIRDLIPGYDGIFIPGHVPSSKNSKRVMRLKNGKTLVINSKAVMKYKKESALYWNLGKGLFKKLLTNHDKPYRIFFLFVRKTKAKFDYINPAQTVQDIMTDHEWLVDDNCDELVPYFLKHVVNTKHPGVYVVVKRKS